MFNQGRLPGYGQGRQPRYDQGRPLRYDRRMENLDGFDEDSDTDDFRNGETMRSSASQDTDQQQQQQQQPPSNSGGYTVISPDEKKRRKLLEQAERERQMYEEHRRQRTPTHMSYVGAVGREYGLTQSEARQQQIRTHAQHNKTSRLLKEAERRTKQREAEDKVLEKKKMAARKQADKNAQREQERRELWRDDMKRANQAFLNKLEAESKATAAAEPPPPPPPSNPQPPLRQHPSSNPAKGRQQDRPRESVPLSRKEAASSTLAGQRNSSRDSPLARGDVRKSTKSTEHQLFPNSFFPPAQTELASNHPKLQPKSTRSARDARNGELSSNTTGHQKKSVQGSETGPGKGEASSKNSGGFGSLYSASATSRMVMPVRPTTGASTFGSSSRSENPTPPAMANSLGVSSLGGRNSGSSYARVPSSQNSLFAGGLDEVSSSKSSHLDGGTLQGSLASGYRSWIWHVGGGEFGGSDHDRSGSERLDIKEETSEGSFCDEYGFEDSYSSKQKSGRVHADGYASEVSYGGGRSFDDLRSCRERSDSLHPRMFSSETSCAEEFPYASDMAMDVDGPEESGFGHGYRNSMEFSASAEEARSNAYLRTQDKALADDEDEDDLSAEEEKEKEDDGLLSESALEKSVDVWERFQTLQKRFPHFDQMALWDILLQCSGSMEQAMQLLAL